MNEQMIQECLAIMRDGISNQNKRIEALETLLTKSIDAGVQILRGADERLASANKMVYALADSVNGLKDMCCDLENRYATHIQQVCECRDKMQEENMQMRRELSFMRQEMFNALKSLASRPVITNSNLAIDDKC